MAYNDSEILKSSFKSNEAYEQFIRSLDMARVSLGEDYEFLGLKDKTWDDIFLTCALEGAKSNNREVVTKQLIKVQLNDYIKER
ncbi:MAG: hypothetical protein K2J20_03300, partial [Bacilli bacterium]|nr:hypothetical protein [Bacilli bacterium]